MFGGYGADSNMASCTVNSPTEVAIVLNHPYSSFLLSQTITSFGINSPTALAALDADNPDPDEVRLQHRRQGRDGWHRPVQVR